VRKAASRGWCLFPIKAREKKPPLVKGWRDKATCNLEQLEAWAVEFPNCNWGLATGPGSGVFILDMDGEPGRASLIAFHRQGNEIPDTLTVNTERGSHLYFRWPEGQSIGNSTQRISPGLDIRAEGGYVVIPPSFHPSGTQYAFDDPNESIAEAPKWLLEMVMRNESPAVRLHRAEIGILYEGQRNDGLFRRGCALRRRGASLEELRAELLQANARNCSPPLSDEEALRIAASAATYPVGGPDPLETAWGAVLTETHTRGYEQFIAIARNLQLERQGLSIALPLERIGDLMARDWTQVRRWRQRAVREGWLQLKECSVPHRRAALYVFTELLRVAVPLGRCPTNRYQ
jgi:Bifunctional DNA primase/polymerase, N-terminal/Primase C terminal 1 (PriCT-1)